MKHLRLSCFILLTMMMLIVSPVLSASGPIQVNASLQSPSSGIWVRNDTIQTVTPDVICAAYGTVPQYAPGSFGYDRPIIVYSEFSYTNTSKTLDSWYEVGTSVDPFPSEYNISVQVDKKYISVGQSAICQNTNSNYVISMHPYYNNSQYAPAPIANFTASPMNGTAPLYVMFTDTSENECGTCTYNWSLTPTSGISAGATGTLEDHTAMFSTEGNYTVSHGVSCDAGSNTSTKTDYIMVLNGSVLGTLYITAINSLNGYPIQGATLNLNDVENGTWVNATTTTGTSQITGIKTHTVNVYASSPGFANNDKLGIPISNVYDSILMFPENRSNVSAGNVTLFVSVYEGDEHSKPIPNAGVNVIGPDGGSGQYTNSGGTAQFVVANKTTYLVDVQASGHRGATASVYSGTGSGGSATVTVTVYLDKNTVTPTVTQTTLPGGGTPTPKVTILKGCELDPSSPECQASQNNEAMAWISANGLGLVQFFVLCFIVFMIKGMGKR